PTASITSRSLVVSAQGVDKSYDGTVNATVTLSDNRVSGDSLTTSYTTAVFADKNVGKGKSVSVSGISATGLDAGNYSANSVASTTATITAALLTVTADDKSRPFGTTNPAFTMHYSGFLGTDTEFILSGQPAF